MPWIRVFAWACTHGSTRFPALECGVIGFPTAAADVGTGSGALMRCIALLHLEHLFSGARMFTRLLWRNGRSVGRKHVATLMRRMEVEALYRKANTGRRHAARLSVSFARVDHRSAESGLGDRYDLQRERLPWVHIDCGDPAPL